MTEALELRVEGLTATVRGLKEVSQQASRAVGKGLRIFAKELRARAEQKGASLGGVHRHVVDAGGIRHFARADRSGIRLAARQVPPVLGAEFGALAFRQFPRWRGNQFTDPTGSNVGYMVHPAMREFLPEAEERLADEIERLVREAIGGQQ